MTRELGKKTAKCVLVEGVLSIFLAALLLTFVISDISESEFGVSQYVMVYLISVLMSTTLTTLLLFIITCIESLIIMIVDRKFNMRNLLFANYNFFGKNILLSSMLLLAVVHFDSELVKRVFVLVTYVTAIWLIAS